MHFRSGTPGGHSWCVHDVSLSWQQGAVLTGTLALSWGAFRISAAPAARSVVPWAREMCIIAGLYSVWQLAGTLSVTDTSGALDRSAWILRVEHDLHLPSEHSVQKLILHNSVITQIANVYYASMHFAALFAFLIWLFVRYRHRYSAVRTTLALTTLVCLLIQLIPVAPPRLDGFVDTAAQYGQSVYSLGFGADELSAMPSVHVAWAVFVSWYVVRLSASHWRWLAALHAPITVFVVLATGNHWWLDCIVAVAVLTVCAWARYGLGRVMIAIRLHSQPLVTAPLPALPATSSSDTAAQG
jgi:hypothetical protein